MLAARGIVGEDDRDALLDGLERVRAELNDGTFPFEPDDEDVHMAVERRLTALVGPDGSLAAMGVVEAGLVRPRTVLVESPGVRGSSS